MDKRVKQEKAVTDIISVIRDLVRQETDQLDRTVVCRIIEDNHDGTYDVCVEPDEETVLHSITALPGMNLQQNDYAYLYKINNKLSNSFIFKLIGNRTDNTTNENAANIDINEIINIVKSSIDIPEGQLPNDGTLTIQGDGTTATTFTANQSTNSTLNIKGSGGTTVSKTADGEITISSSSVPSVKTLNTTNTTAQATSVSEAIAGSGTIDLHKVAKTGTYGDLIGLPTLGSLASKDKISATDVATGYILPTTQDQINWNNKYTKPATGIPASDLAETYVKPSELATVATTGDYDDLSNKPSLGTAASKNYIDSVTAGSNDLVTSGAVHTAIDSLPDPMIFIGSVGTGGTVEWANLPSASTSKGWTYKVITAHATTPICSVGDTIISNGTDWVVIPSGDEPGGTVTSVGLSMPTGFTVTNSPVTSSGTLTVTFASGYSLPTTAAFNAKVDNTITVTGTGVLGGGGALSSNQTITHNQVLGTAQTTAAVYKTTMDEYGHIASATAATAADVGISLTTTAGSEAITVGSSSLNVMTRDTAQTITGSKTFSGEINFINNSDIPVYITHDKTVSAFMNVYDSNDDANLYLESATTSDRTIVFPDKDGTIALLDDATIEIVDLTVLAGA